METLGMPGAKGTPPLSPSPVPTEPVKRDRTFKLLVILVALVPIGYLLYTNTFTYINSVATPLSGESRTGYYHADMPIGEMIYFYRPAGGGEWTVGKDAMDVVEGADIDTFTALGPLYAKDKDTVYFAWPYSRSVRTLPADPGTFKAIDPYYGHDATTMYHGDKPLTGANPADYRFLDMAPKFTHRGGPRFLYSNGHIFYGDVEISSAKRTAHYLVSRATKPYIPCSDVQELRDGAFYLCAHAGLSEDASVPIDTATFQIIEHELLADASYAKDQKYVYYIDRDSCGTGDSDQLSCGGKYLQAVYVVEGADPNTFVNSNIYDPAADKNSGRGQHLGYENGCRIYAYTVVNGGENVLVHSRRWTPPSSYLGHGGRCLYYVASENPR